MGGEESKPKTRKRITEWKAEFPDYVKEAEHIIRLQELLFNLTPESFDESVSILVEIYLTDTNSINVFVNNLILAAKYRPHNSELLADLFNSVSQRAQLVKQCFLSRIFYPLPESPSAPIYSWGHFRLVHFCLKNKSIEQEEICRLIGNIYNSYPEFVNYILFLFAFFGKEIDECNHKLYSELFDFYNLNQKRPINPLLKEYMFNLTYYQENNWTLLTESIEFGYSTGTLPYSLLHNELPDNLPDYSIEIELSLFAQCPIMQDSNNKPTLIQFCAYHGLVKCFNELLDKNLFEPKVTEYACAGGNASIIEILNARKVDFSGCLAISALHHRYDIYEWLLKEHDDEIQGSIYSCAKSNNIKSLLSCFDNGADVALPDDDAEKSEQIGFTPLHFAAMSGSYEAAHMLSGQPDVESFAKGKDGMTPLILASQYGHKNIVSMLISCKGVSVKEENSGKMNSLHYASMKGHNEIVSLLLGVKGIEINYPASNFSTALHFAAQNGHLEVVRVLLLSYVNQVKQNTIDVNARNKMSCTPLHLAVMNGYANVVQLLLTTPKIDINAANSGSKTPLIIASENESIEIVGMLLYKKGIMRNIEDRTAMTAEKYAEKSRNEELIRLFKDDKDDEDSMSFLDIHS